jgi:serine/threonine-protein kinase
MTEETLFAQALEKADPAQRAAFLDEACAGDPALRARLEALLGSHERAGSFLKPPVLARPGGPTDPISGEPEGGMGIG